MITHSNSPGLDRHHWSNETLWQQLYSLLRPIVKCWVKFPRKQQLVLLIDLAGRMNFSSQTPLQKAFLDAGINLQAYQLLVPRDSKVRKRNASLLNHAYHRLLKLEPVQKYIADL